MYVHKNTWKEIFIWGVFFIVKRTEITCTYIICWKLKYCVLSTIEYLMFLSLSCVWLFLNRRIPRCQVSLSFTIFLFAQTHVLWVDDAIQLTHPLSSPSPPALNLSQPQGLFQWVNSLPQVTKILELQNQSFQLMFKVDFLWIDWLDLLSVQGVLKSSPAPQFKNIISLVLSLIYGPTLTFVHNY